MIIIIIIIIIIKIIINNDSNVNFYFCNVVSNLDWKTIHLERHWF